MNQTRLEYLQELAETVKLFVCTWSPGDGVTRYRFARDDNGYFVDYGIYTALGYKEALTYVEGYRAGYFANEQ